MIFISWTEIKKNPLLQILAFVYPEQVKCFNSLGQLSLSAPRPEIRLYPRLIGSSNKPITTPSKMTFTKAAFFKFDENVYNHYRIYCQWTISPDWHNICLVCAIPMLCHWFCHSNATEILRTSYTHCNFCKMQRTTTLARDRCSCRNHRRYFYYIYKYLNLAAILYMY